MNEKKILKFECTVVKGAEYESVTCVDKEGVVLFAGTLAEFSDWLQEI